MKYLCIFVLKMTAWTITNGWVTIFLSISKYIYLVYLMAFRYTWLPTFRVTSLSNLFSLIAQAIWFSRHWCSVVTYFRCIWDGSQPFVQMSFKSVWAYICYALERIWDGIEQPLHLPCCWMLDFCSEFFTEGSWYCCWPYTRVAILLPKISYQKCKMDNFNFSPIFPNFKLLLSLYLPPVMRLLFLTYIFGKLIMLWIWTIYCQNLLSKIHLKIPINIRLCW